MYSSGEKSFEVSLPHRNVYIIRLKVRIAPLSLVSGGRPRQDRENEETMQVWSEGRVSDL